MTAVDYILIIIAVVIMVVGLYIIIRGVLNAKTIPTLKPLSEIKMVFPSLVMSVT